MTSYIQNGSIIRRERTQINFINFLNCASVLSYIIYLCTRCKKIMRMKDDPQIMHEMHVYLQAGKLN